MRKKFLSLTLALSMLMAFIPILNISAESNSIPIFEGDTVLNEWKFDFGAEDSIPEKGYTLVTPDMDYTTRQDYGFLGTSALQAGGGTGLNTAIGAVGTDSNGLSMDIYYPMSFSMSAKADSYYRLRATVTTFDTNKDALIYLSTETRHLILNQNINAGETATVEFTVRTKKDVINIWVYGDNSALAALEIQEVESAPVIWLVGDSTLADCSCSLPLFPKNNFSGLGHGLSLYFSRSFAMVNIGRGGASAEDSTQFQTINDNIKSGDYLYLQHGHNHKTIDSYTSSLDKYYNLCKAVGAKFIIVSPIEKISYCSGSQYGHTLRNIALAGEQYVNDKISNGAKDIAYVDLNKHSLEWYNSIVKQNNYDVNSIKDYFNGDEVHPNDIGAQILASEFFKAAQEVTDTTQKAVLSDLLAYRLPTEPDVTSSPTPTVEPTPSVTSTPEVTVEPTPDITSTPEATVEPTPDVTSSPIATPTIEPTAEPTPTPTPEPISTLKITGVDRRNRVIKGIKVEGDTNTENAIGIVALYNSDGTLKHLETTKSNKVIHGGTYELNHSITYDNDKDICKVFVWKGFDTLKPLATVYNVPPYEYSVETICKANTLENMTIDDAGYIYYVKDNIIYKCEVETGNKAEYFNPESMEYIYGKSRLSNFDIDNIVYNNYSDKIYMFGHYTEKDYEELLCNYAVYEITNQTADFIYFSKTYGYVKDYCGIVMPVDEDTAYVYSENSMSTSITDNSVWFDLNDGTYRRAGTAFKNNYIFKADGEYYDFYYIGRQLRFIGSSSATEATDVDGAKAIDNANLNFAYPNNTQGFVAYNEKLYYAGETSGDIYCMDLEGFKNKYIYSSDVYQHGDNTVDVSYYAYLQYFNMDYNGLPIWYDEAQGTIKRYKRN